MAEWFVPQVAITVDGVDLPAKFYNALVEVHAECSVQLPDQVRLAFIDSDFELYDESFWSIGQKVTVALSSSGVPSKVAECLVSTIGMEPGLEASMTLTITAYGMAHQLYRGVRIHTWVDCTDSEVVTKLAGELGLSADVDSTDTRHAYVVQAGPTNRFLDERALLNDCRWWVSDNTLHFKTDMPTSQPVPLTWGGNLLSLRVVSSSAAVRKQMTTRSWDPDVQQSISADVTASDPAMPDIGTDAPGPKALAGAARTGRMTKGFTGSHPTSSDADARQLATSLARRAATTEVTVRGVALGDPRLKAGSVADVQDAGSKLSGQYQLAWVEHVYSAATGYVTRFSSGGQDSTGLVDLLAGAAQPREWNPNALMIGVVTALSDPEGTSRVRVSFPNLDDTVESAWARLVAPGAGKGRGLHLCPEVGDEVLIGFENGDPARPMVLGGLWSKGVVAPLAQESLVKNGTIASRSWTSRGGHSITFHDDSADKPDSIVVSLKGETAVLTMTNEGVTLTSKKDISITADNALSLTAKGAVTMKGQSVTIEAENSLNVEAVQLQVKASGPSKIEAATLDIKAQATCTLDGGGMTTIKGGMVSIN